VNCLQPLRDRVRSYAMTSLLFQPDSNYKYSNAGINTAGRILEVVSGAEARKDPLMSDADSDGSYIRIQLARPVPPEGTFRVIFREVPCHPQQPRPRVLNVFPNFPLFPESQKRFLGNVQGEVRIHPAGVRQSPNFPTVRLIQRLEDRPPGGSRVRVRNLR